MDCPHCGKDTEKDIVTADLQIQKDAKGRKHVWMETTKVDGKIRQKRIDTYFYRGESVDSYRINMQVHDKDGKVISNIDTK